MRSRLELHEILVEILGSRNVYFNPPANIQLKYPCIVYERDYIDAKYSSDKPYLNTLRYQITLIDENPDSEYLERLSLLPMCHYDRHFVSDNLHHDVFKIYY